MLVHFIYVVALAFIDDAENDDAAREILRLIRVFEDDGFEFFLFGFYSKRFFPKTFPVSFVLWETFWEEAAVLGCFLLGLHVLLICFCCQERMKCWYVLQAFDDDIRIRVLDELLLQFEDIGLDAFHVNDSFRSVFIMEDEIREVFHLADTVAVFHVRWNDSIRDLHIKGKEPPVLRLLRVIPDLLDENVIAALVQRIELDAVDVRFVGVVLRTGCLASFGERERINDAVLDQSRELSMIVIKRLGVIDFSINLIHLFRSYRLFRAPALH